MVVEDMNGDAPGGTLELPGDGDRHGSGGRCASANSVASSSSRPKGDGLDRKRGAGRGSVVPSQPSAVPRRPSGNPGAKSAANPRRGSQLKMPANRDSYASSHRDSNQKNPPKAQP